MKSRSKECKEFDDRKKHYPKREVGFVDNIIIGFTVAIANVTDSEQCNGQANAAVLVAGDDINAELENDTRINVNVDAGAGADDGAPDLYTPERR
jgi:hypothetical protein